jgi:hypothetical protein
MVKQNCQRKEMQFVVKGCDLQIVVFLYLHKKKAYTKGTRTKLLKDFTIGQYGYDPSLIYMAFLFLFICCQQECDSRSQ